MKLLADMDNRMKNPQSPSPRPTPTVLPPLSKFYYGPAQGWTSTEASPSHNGGPQQLLCFSSPFGLLADQLSSDSTWSLHSHQSDFSSTVPPRLSPAVPAYSSSQWQNDFSSSIGEPKPWQVAPRNAMSANAQAADKPSATSGRAYSPINTGWGSRPSSPTSDSSTWDGNHNRTNIDSSQASPKPPLPVCDSYPQRCRCAGPNVPKSSTGLLQIVVALK